MHLFLQRLLSNIVIQGILFACFIWFLIQIKGILILFFISYILMAALTEYVDFLRSKNIPKILAIVIPYITFLLLVVSIIFPLVPFFSSQLQHFSTRFPEYIQEAAATTRLNVNMTEINSFFTKDLQTLGQNAFDITTKIFGGIFATLTVGVLAFYLLVERDSYKKMLASFFPRHEAKTLLIIKLIEEKLGAWFRGQIILSLSIGCITWVALTLLGVEFALPLAILAGILEILPTIGPIISAIPAVIITLNTSISAAFVVAGVYILIQALENNLLVPRIMQKAVGLSPVIIILGVVIGGELMGVLGSLLSVPFISLLVLLYNQLKKA